MSRLRVLIAAPHDPFNPYCRELGGGYRAQGCDVAYGRDMFWTGHGDADVVHVQWPEHLLLHGMRLPDDVPTVRQRLAEWRRRAVVIGTVHNAGPHDRRAGWEELYGAVYAECDGLVHHGRRSREWLSATFPALASLPATVVPFGAYGSFPITLDRATARRSLGIRAEERVVLVFGRMRTAAELALVSRGFARAKLKDARLVVSDSFPVRRLASIWNIGLKAWYFGRLRHAFLPPWLPVEDVQRPFLAADLLLIQRVSGLNASNLALAFTFSLPVVSPDVGVFGEAARDTGNPVFSPPTPAMAAEALRQAFALDLPALGRRNREVAEREWNWPTIAGRLLEFEARLRRDRAADLL